MIFNIRRPLLGQNNCNCSRIVTLTGVTVTDRACTHLIPALRETGDKLYALHVTPLDRLGVLPVPQVGAAVRDDGVREPEALADGDEGDRDVGGDANGHVVQVVPDVAVHL